jgi:hypothetical protein
MCVTNTTSRRPQPVSFNAGQVSVSQSVLSQRLLGNFSASGLPPKQPLYNHQAPHVETEYISNTPEEKQRPKRRRKPQKPGKTAKNNERHFVVHNYHDHALDADDFEQESEDPNQRRRGGVSVAFPVKLHAVLDQVEADGLAHVISWQGHGRCFVIHKPKEFVDHVMPKYFRQTKLTSFQRQLNLYGFCRLTRGKDAGGYYHELFLRGRIFLCKKMIRTKVKGTKFKAASSPESEPDFYTLPPVVVSPHSSDEEMSHESSRLKESYATMVDKSLMPAPTNSYFEPLPVQYPNFQQGAGMISYYAQGTPASQPQSYPLANFLAAPSDADRVLDEAVDELFLQHEGADDNLAEFVHDWDPTIEQANSFGANLQDDSQLGYMLEKLLED